MSTKAERYYQFLETAKRLDKIVGSATTLHEALGQLYAALDTAEAVGCNLGDPEVWRENRAGCQKGLDALEEVISSVTRLFGAHLSELEVLAAQQERTSQISAAARATARKGEPS